MAALENTYEAYYHRKENRAYEEERMILLLLLLPQLFLLAVHGLDSRKRSQGWW